MNSIKNKVVIISGGSRGIGRACCLAFARAGAKVVFTYKNSRAEAEALVKEIEKLKTEVLPLQADVKDFDQCKKVSEKTRETFKTIDILINNAGITRDKALMMMRKEDWQDVIDTNLGGTFNMTRHCITTFLKQKKGCIINISSVSGIAGIARQTNYSASKAGIIGFTRSLAKETASYGVRVNAVCPGFIDTDMVNSIREDIKETIKESIPVKRLGTAEEVAGLCLYLAGEKAAYITGEIIKMDGGLTV